MTKGTPQVELSEGAMRWGITLHYLGPSVNRVLREEAGRPESERYWKMLHGGYGDGGRGQEPRVVGSLGAGGGGTWTLLEPQESPALSTHFMPQLLSTA